MHASAVSIDNFLECWAKPVVLVVVVQEGVVADFGLWSVYIPPSSLGPVGFRIVPGTMTRGSLGFRDRLPAERGPGTG